MKTVAYTCPFVPPEWIAAHGLRPSRLILAADGRSSRAAAGVCPFAKALADAAAGNETAATVFTTACDQMRRAPELAAAATERPLFLLNVPATWQTPAAFAMYVEEIRRLGRFLIRLGGQAPTPEKLANVMTQYDDARTHLKALRPRLSPREFSERIARLHQDGPDADMEPRRGMAILAMRPTGVSHVESSESPQGRDDPATHGRDAHATKGGVPVALVGGPLMREGFRLFDLIEQAGGSVALDATESGEISLPAAFDRRSLREEPLLELAGAYLGRIPHVFQRPNTLLYSWLKRELAARGVRGILLWRYVWCDKWHAEARRMKDWAGVPLVEIDGGEDPAAEARTATRIQSLLEMLK